MTDAIHPAKTLVTLGQFGERTRPLRYPLRETALIIGLGSLGLQALAQARTMITAMLPARDIKANVRLLAIARKRSIREDTLLPRDERLMLQLDPFVWSKVPGQYAPLNVARWWPHTPRAPEFFEDPTRARVYSRLMLFTNAQLVGETLFLLGQWLFESGTGRESERARRIYILASLAEPEASGMLFDVASRLRALCTARTPAGMSQPAIIGVFTLRGSPDPHDPDCIQAMAHVYATLREIDSYCLHPDTYRSELPVIGHVLPTVEHPAPPLDMIMMTGDTAQNGSNAPESVLAECVATWIAASATPPDQAPALPIPISHAPGTDHFRGYTTFGFSKLALPTRSAMDLAAVGVALTALRVVKQMHPGTPTTEWTGPMVEAITDIVLDSNLENRVAIQFADWARLFSVPGLLRTQQARQKTNESGKMQDVVQSEWRRLEAELVGTEALDQGNVDTVPNTLRAWIDSVLAQSLQEVTQTLDNSPLDLAYGQGYGLVWTVSALEELSRLLYEQLNALISVRLGTEEGRQTARKALIKAADEYDKRSEGRKKPPADALDNAADDAFKITLELMIADARAYAYQTLYERAKQYMVMVRDVIPHVDQAVQSLRNFENNCRQQMGDASEQPPQFPAGVALTRQWYADGTQSLNSLNQSSPRELLSRLFQAWPRPDDLTVDRLLSHFLFEARIAARRVLSSAFNFEDMRSFMSRASGPMYRQALPDLLRSATPMLCPVNGTHYEPADAFEIVREVVREGTRELSLVPSPQQPNVIRSQVPSPDQDEIAVLRLLHGVVADSLPTIADRYRRAYDQTLVEGVPLHIDRRWDATMADLVHTDIRREISAIWNDLISALRSNPDGISGPLNALALALKTALNANEMNYVLNVPHDLSLAVYKLRPIRLKLPPPTCPVIFCYSTRPVEEVAENIVQAVRLLPVEEPFAFVVNVNERPDIDLIVEPLRRLNHIVIVLSEADVKHLIGARLPMRALRDVVLNKVQLTNVSPFYTRGPVPEHMFFGRAREISDARSKLRTHSVALIGGRRIGKTSTLHHIEKMLLPRESEYVPYYLDCSNVRDYQTLFWKLSRQWALQIPDTPNPVFFEDVIADLQSRHPGQGIAVLMDEVDGLLTFDQDESLNNHEILFRTFRSLSNERRCQFIFSGEKWLMASITNPYSALFNFTQPVRLKPLPQKIVHQLVSEPFENLNVWMEEADAIIERIYEISAGHPSIVQMICQGMVEQLDRIFPNSNLIGMPHLEEAIQQHTLQEQIVYTIWGQMDELARLITLIWPEGTRVLSMQEIERKLSKIGVPPVDPAVLQETAHNLDLYCFVRPREHGQLELIPTAFPAILAFMTDKENQIKMILQQYLEKNPPRASHK